MISITDKAHKSTTSTRNDGVKKKQWGFALPEPAFSRRETWRK